MPWVENHSSTLSNFSISLKTLVFMVDGVLIHAWEVVNIDFNHILMP